MYLIIGEGPVVYREQPTMGGCALTDRLGTLSAEGAPLPPTWGVGHYD